jgi:hypothetical protein
LSPDPESGENYFGTSGEFYFGIDRSGEAITINTLDRVQDRAAGPISDLTFEHIRGRMEGAVNLIRAGRGDISNVTISDVRLSQFVGVHGTGTSYDLRPTAEDRLEVAQDHGRMNAWRLDAAGKVVGLCPYPGGLPGLFARGVAGMNLDAVSIERPTPLPTEMHPQTIIVEDQDAPQAP